MESVFLTEAFKQAPTLGVLALIVWFFLKHLTRVDERNHVIQRDAIRAINENNIALGKNHEALNAVNHTLKRLNGHRV